MIKNKQIIIVGLQPWDIKIGSNCKSIAKTLAQQNSVLYVNSPLNRKTMLFSKQQPEVKERLEVIAAKRPAISNPQKNLWVLTPPFLAESINWIPYTPLFRMFNKWQSQRFAKAIQNAVKELDFQNFILFNDGQMFLGLHLKELLNPIVSIYYFRDNITTQPYFRKHGKAIEKDVMRESDVVVTNSTYLEDYARRYNPESYMTGQGCDLSLFNDDDKKMEIPPEFSEVPGTVVGYVGVLTQARLDIGLIQYLARQRKDWSIVLVGPEDEAFKRSSLHQMENVFFFGSKPESDLPRYIKGFDVCINPQVVNEMTRGNYPRKVDEYLAMGKPVVVTATRAMDYFTHHVYLAAGKEAYVRLIEKALKENQPEKEQARKAFARSHTWENHVKNIFEAAKLQGNNHE